jgi:hypothetical protein
MYNRSNIMERLMYIAHADGKKSSTEALEAALIDRKADRIPIIVYKLFISCTV